MDLSNPLRSVAPSVEADVLAVLAGTHAPLSGLRIQQLAERSYGQVRHVLQRLVEHGLVMAERHGNTSTYVLNRDHVLAAPVEAMVEGASTVEASIQDLVNQWEVQPVIAALFGSFARRDGNAASDIDVLLVRPDNVDVDDEVWTAQRTEFIRAIEGWSGNRIQLVELSGSEVDEASATEQPLVRSIRTDGVFLRGSAADLGSSLLTSRSR